MTSPRFVMWGAGHLSGECRRRVWAGTRCPFRPVLESGSSPEGIGAGLIRRCSVPEPGATDVRAERRCALIFCWAVQVKQRGLGGRAHDRGLPPSKTSGELLLLNTIWVLELGVDELLIPAAETDVQEAGPREGDHQTRHSDYPCHRAFAHDRVCAEDRAS